MTEHPVAAHEKREARFSRHDDEREQRPPCQHAASQEQEDGRGGVSGDAPHVVGEETAQIPFTADQLRVDVAGLRGNSRGKPVAIRKAAPRQQHRHQRDRGGDGAQRIAHVPRSRGEPAYDFKRRNSADVRKPLGARPSEQSERDAREHVIAGRSGDAARTKIQPRSQREQEREEDCLQRTRCPQRELRLREIHREQSRQRPQPHRTQARRDAREHEAGREVQERRHRLCREQKVEPRTRRSDEERPERARKTLDAFAIEREAIAREQVLRVDEHDERVVGLEHAIEQGMRHAGRENRNEDCDGKGALQVQMSSLLNTRRGRCRSTSMIARQIGGV